MFSFPYAEGWSEWGSKSCTFSQVSWPIFRAVLRIKLLQLAIQIYSNQAEYFGFSVFSVVISRVDGERVAYWNSHQSLG